MRLFLSYLTWGQTKKIAFVNLRLLSVVFFLQLLRLALYSVLSVLSLLLSNAGPSPPAIFIVTFPARYVFLV